MKKKKIILCILLVLIMVFGSISSCYANVGTGIIAFFNLFHSLENGEVSNLLDFIDQTFQNSGLLGVKIPGNLQTLEEYVHENYPELEGETSEETQENVSDYLTTNITVNDNDKSYTFNDNSRTFFVDLGNYCKNESTGKIYYCCDLQQSQQFFTTAEITNISGILQDYPNYIFYLFYNGSDNWLLGLSPNGGQLYGVCRYRFENQDIWWSCIFYRAKTVNGIVSCERFVAQSEDDMVAFYRTNGSGNDFEKTQLTYPWNGNYVNSSGQPYDSCYLTSLSGQSVGGNGFMQYPKGITMTNQSLLCFASDSALQTYINTYGIGKQQYYYNNQTWSNFVNSTGDYTIDNSNVNTVTYGDVINYVNDYHDTNNNYPDNSTVNNWINTTNNNNTGGGGSGGGDNGGGGSGGSGSEGVFDFLSELGAVLGNLIKNVGQAFTNIIKGISDLIESIVTDLPTVFFDFIGSLFGWLPDEWVTLLSLSLAAMLIWGIVKVIRG